MTANSPGPEAGPDGGMRGMPAGLDCDDLDVLSLAGLEPPAAGDWLLVTALESQPGGGFTARHLHEHDLTAHGGDVLVRVTRETGPPGQPRVRAQVWAVIGGRAVLAGNWDQQDPGGWPEQVRPAAAFAMGLITELEENGASLGPGRKVRLDDPDAATVGVPFGITSGQPAGPGRPPS